MAQTALAQGVYVAQRILAKHPLDKTGKPKSTVGAYCNTPLPKPYKPINPIYAIPVGPGWAAVLIGNWQFYGKLGWILRRYLDWVVFSNLLPLSKAWTAFRSHGQLTESCETCNNA
jgi:NADH dehydrogenase FAD-containing subunit